MKTVIGGYTTALASIGAIGLMAVATGCELPEFPQVNDEPSPEMVDDFELNGHPEEGAEFYASQCASCHGEQGQGDGPAAQQLRPPATDFTQHDLDPQRAYLVTREGGRAFGMSPAMPAFREAADDQQLRDVTAYILEFQDGDTPDQQADADEPIPQNGDAGDADEPEEPPQ